MHIGLLEVEGRVFASTSLKDKRRVIQSVQVKIRNKFNLSVAEVEFQDDRQFTALAVVGVGSHAKVVEQELLQALRLIENAEGLEVTHTSITFM
ncbi:DUF503 domain-containing protein [Laceyella putida]|uniref:DUF503 domain-containing protein n=1 Tax=Laceyella putida TaxID=110101 RepID=A0ABW2RPD7_9BACL